MELSVLHVTCRITADTKFSEHEAKAGLYKHKLLKVFIYVTVLNVIVILGQFVNVIENMKVNRGVEKSLHTPVNIMQQFCDDTMLNIFKIFSTFQVKISYK